MTLIISGIRVRLRRISGLVLYLLMKLKTHKGTAKRIWKSGGGKLRRRHAMRSHHRGRKSVKQSLGRGRVEPVPDSNPRIKELIPYK